MPDLQIHDMNRLAFPSGVRERFAAVFWHQQDLYGKLLIIFGAVLFLMGGLM